MNRLLILSLFALPLAACQTPEKESVEATAMPVTNASDTDADRADLEAIGAAYQAALRTGDHATIAALYAGDAVIHPANRPSERGREALDAYFEATDSEPEDITNTPVDIVVSDAGDMAYEAGTLAGPGWTGKYLTVHRKVDGRWLIVADSWSEDTPPTPAK